MRRKNVNINELIYDFFVLVPGTLNELITFYRPMVVKIFSEKLGSIMKDSSQVQDSLNRADLLLIDCLYYYHGYEDTSFTTFYRKSVNNLAINILRKISRERKHTYDMVYLDSKVKEDSNMYLVELTGSKENLHEDVIIHIQYEELMKKARLYLSALELDILELKMQEYTNIEIANRLQISARAVSYRLKKIKNTLFYAGSK